jgi:NAD(P)-dependent dehydrogenase (short-subunit alcohol dehydrogenase family)
MPSKQKPIPSGFGPLTTAEEAIQHHRLDDKTVVVTGGYSGLGLEITRVLAKAGATVVVPARSPQKATRALAGISRVEQATLDLLDPRSIDAFSAGFLQSGRRLHALVNCAGIMATPFLRDGRGYESQFAANHLGHFQLTMRLWPALVRASGARVVSVSSRGHRISGIDFEDPNFERRTYDKWKAYGQSKTANALFAVTLDQLGEAHGVRALSLHPGTVLTDLARDLSISELLAFGVSRDVPHGHIPPGKAADEGGDYKNIAQGAATAVWCAASPQLEGIGGVYCEDVDIAPAVAADHPGHAGGVRPWAMDATVAEQLWWLSERLTGLRFCA